uniref:Uncharacterized protein n=1 Tax=Arundo donax TaxID=35708 RepID=A0A0A9BBR7_ARUDO
MLAANMTPLCMLPALGI